MSRPLHVRLRDGADTYVPAIVERPAELTATSPHGSVQPRTAWAPAWDMAEAENVLDAAVRALPPPPAPTLPPIPEPGLYMDESAGIWIIHPNGGMEVVGTGQGCDWDQGHAYGPFTRLAPAPDLASLLAAIRDHDTDYPVRYGLILEALAAAHRLGYKTGFGWGFDSSLEVEGYAAVVYIQLPTGLVSWHMPEWPEHDGHTPAEKLARIEAYLLERVGGVR